MNGRGFTLLSSVFWVFLCSGLMLLLHQQAATRWRLSLDVESQLQALTIAENGIEYARTILPHLELNSLLTGADGQLCSAPDPQWRNPLSWEEARTLSDLDDWKPGCDDGILSPESAPPGTAGPSGATEARFFLRFSNNPEEARERDEDQIVLVRSLGVVRGRLADPFFPKHRNHAVLVEARLRQERAFSLDGALTLFADSAQLLWEGTGFSLQGGLNPAVSVVSPQFPASPLLPAVIDSLTPEQRDRLRGGSGSGGVRDDTALFRSQAGRLGLFEGAFWNHFLQQLPRFSRPPGKGEGPALYWAPQGLVLEEKLEGLLVARGDLTIRGSARVSGIVLHLGGGKVRLEEEARIEGALWLSGWTEAIGFGAVSLRLGESAAILHDPERVEGAVRLLPATQLGWRIIFPEMVQ